MRILIHSRLSLAVRLASVLTSPKRIEREGFVESREGTRQGNFHNTSFGSVTFPPIFSSWNQRGIGMVGSGETGHA